MNILVIGASGLVGSHLLQTCQQRGWNVMGTSHNVPQPGLIPLEITDETSVKSLITQSQPKVVFLPAFLSNVDYCEQNPEETYQINVVGCLNVAQATREVGAKFIFYSSDYVFNGENGPYQEIDEPDPICVYGRQKLEVEHKISELLDNYLICRIAWVYGQEKQGKNFVLRLISTLKNHQTIRVPQDQIGSPTWANDIAEASCRLIEVEAKGLFHTTGSDCINRYQFAVKIAEMFGLDADLIIPVNTSQLNQVAPRPLKCGMRCDRLNQMLNWNLRGVVDGLSHIK
ncbi:SDR family oxidoreductase [Planktothrix paucivesiculata]|uniref:dTDP-4-dehydrorhamnose reductase n=1 Tax=Planktothrix paucivesiculata PCC 9631 TaxID=671071 RepID=A0A7Z9C054_9CYAN|nr:SDR family oxidoreductase [Planktothrix paucivesiculata]VXD24625.1 putative dTDP-4-dehydrorhamnose reductase [Planktothrix paucivesiculata PCC 9631]